MDSESQACKEQELGNAAYTKNDFVSYELGCCLSGNGTGMTNLVTNFS